MNAQTPIEAQAATTGHNSDATHRVTAGGLRAFVERIDSPKIADLVSLMDEFECWRPVVGAEGYSVSSWGRVKGKRVDEIRMNKAHGYHQFCISGPDGVKTVRLPAVVLGAFVGPRPFPEAHAAHGDGDKDNNRLSNLRWSTAAENQADIERHGSRCKGSDVHGSVLSERDIPRIRARIKTGERYPKIAKDFGVSVSTISLIKRERIWRHV